MSYDIIGDIHGQYDKLVALLTKLGYRETMGTWRHPDRTAIFVGDLIDGKGNHVATVDLVRSMVDAGAARAVMGNHEFNAIAWATEKPGHPGKYLRCHGDANKQTQHKAFLDEVAHPPRYAEIIDWFRTLPLWLDLGGIRVIHACWNEEHMAMLQPQLGPGTTLTEALIVSSNTKDNPEFEAVEVLCKGVEVELPDGITFRDKHDKERDTIRVRWWESHPITYRDAALAPAAIVEQLPYDRVPTECPLRPYSGPPVFVGHYWLTSRPAPLAPNIACVDYSAGAGGALVAYRWQGEDELRAEHFEST